MHAEIKEIKIAIIIKKKGETIPSIRFYWFVRKQFLIIYLLIGIQQFFKNISDVFYQAKNNVYYSY